MKTFLTALALLLSAQGFSADKAATQNDRPSQLDDLIRGEMSAVKAYNTALEKVKDKSEMKQLTTIRKDHMDAVAKLKSYASKDVREDTDTAGVWGVFATAYTGGAKLFGNNAAVKALKQGEEHGVNEYEEALKDDNINSELKNTIRTQLLPKQQGHIKTISTFM